MEERIIELELALTHQAELLSKLNQVLYEQQQGLDVLREEVRRLRELVLDQLTDRLPNEKPPHY